MVVLGLILILLGLLVGGYTVMGGLPGEAGTDVSLSFLGLNVQTSAVVVFALGALTLLLIELGVMAMRSGARKSAKRRAELQRLRRVEAEVRTRESAEVAAQRHHDARRRRRPRPLRPPRHHRRHGQHTRPSAPTGPTPTVPTATSRTCASPTTHRHPPRPVGRPPAGDRQPADRRDGHRLDRRRDPRRRHDAHRPPLTEPHSRTASVPR